MNEGDNERLAQAQLHKRVFDVIRRLGDVSSQTEAIILEVRARALSYCAHHPVDQILICDRRKDNSLSTRAFLSFVAPLALSCFSASPLLHFAHHMISVVVNSMSRDFQICRCHIIYCFLIAGKAARSLEGSEEAQDHSRADR